MLSNPRALPPVTQGSALQAALVVCYLYRGRCPRLLFSSAFQALERSQGTCDVTTLQAPECLWILVMCPSFQALECLRRISAVMSYPHRTDATYGTLLPGRQYFE